MQKDSHVSALAYTDHGTGLPVIFLHAFPFNRHMWDGEIQALQADRRYRLIAPDWRGFGESELSAQLPSPPSLLTMELFVDDLVGLLDALEIQQAVLCCSSMGGYAAFAFARTHAERLRGLVLAGTRPGADTPQGRVSREEVAQLVETQGASAFADLQLPRLISASTRLHHPEVEAHVRQLIEAASPQAIAAASRGMALRADSNDLLATIACPTLVIVGSEDALTPLQTAQDYSAQIPGAQLAVIPQAGHLSNLEQPPVFLQHLREFLQRLS